MGEIDDLKRLASELHSAQIIASIAIVEVLIENGVCSEQAAYREFEKAAMMQPFQILG